MAKPAPSSAHRHFSSAAAHRSPSTAKPASRAASRYARDTSQPAFRLFDIDISGSSPNFIVSGLTLQGLTLKDGLAQGFSSDSGGGALGAGGAIFNQGNLTIDRCTFAGNAAQGGASGDGSGNYGGAGVGSAPPAPGSSGGGPNGGSRRRQQPCAASAAAVSAVRRQARRVDSAAAAAKVAADVAAPAASAGAAAAVQVASRQAAGFGGGSGRTARVLPYPRGGGGAGMGGAIFNDAGTLSHRQLHVHRQQRKRRRRVGAGAAGGARFRRRDLQLQRDVLEHPVLHAGAQQPWPRPSGGSARRRRALQPTTIATVRCRRQHLPECVRPSSFDLENSIFAEQPRQHVHDIAIDRPTPRPAIGYIRAG